MVVDTGVISFYRCVARKGLGESAVNERPDAKESGMASRKRVMLLAAVCAAAIIGSGANAQDASPKLLFHVSADTTLTADTANGEAVPNFQSKVAIVPTGKSGGAIEWPDD